MGLLYKLDFASGKSYIGVTIRGINERMSGHKHYVNKGSEYSIHRAWRKYGEPKVTVLAIANGPFLFELERKAIAVYGTYGAKGYNSTFGGEGVTMTPEIKGNYIDDLR